MYWPSIISRFACVTRPGHGQRRLTVPVTPEGHVGDYAHGITGHEGLPLPPYLPEGGPVAPDVVAVLDLVVYQREVVDKLQGDSRGHGVSGSAAGSFAR